MKRWTQDEKDKLKKLSKTFDVDEIAKLLSRSPSSVKKQLKKLKLEAKESKKENFDKVIADILDKVHNISWDKLPIIQAPTLIQKDGDEEEAILHLTDIHIGRKTISYNSEVAAKRMYYLVEKLLKIVALYRLRGPVKKINVFITGDIVNSEDVGYRVDLSEVEKILRDQIFGENGAVEIMSWVFRNLLANFEEVKIFCVRGNHGKGPKGTSEKTNWDDVVYYTLKYMFANNPRIKIEVADDFYLIAEIMKWKFLLIHGDQIRGGVYGIPFYGILQRALRWGTAFKEEKNWQIMWQIMIVGHFHVADELEQNDQLIFTGGTFVSNDDYVLREYGWNSTTKQWLLFVHPKQGITARYKINIGNIK